MGLKLWTGLQSGADVAEEEVTAKMGLNPEARAGFVPATGSALLAGAEEEVAVPEAEELLVWLDRPNRAGPAGEAWLRVKAEGSPPPAEVWEGGGSFGASAVVDGVRFKPPVCPGGVNTKPRDKTEPVRR